MKKKLLLTIAGLTAFASLRPNCFANEQGSDSPAGVSGIFTAVTTGGLYDPYVGSAQRIVDDIVVPGTVGAYPLKWTRYFNSHTTGDRSSTGGAWRFSYLGYEYRTYSD